MKTVLLTVYNEEVMSKYYTYNMRKHTLSWPILFQLAYSKVKAVAVDVVGKNYIPVKIKFLCLLTLLIGKILLMSPIVIKCANQSLIGCRNKQSFVLVVSIFK